MLIKLKEKEIVAAVRAHIAAQGINLTGKTVKMDFTAGRGDSGLTVDIDIEDEDPPNQIGAVAIGTTTRRQNVTSLAPAVTPAPTSGEPLKVEANEPKGVDTSVDPKIETPAEDTKKSLFT